MHLLKNLLEILSFPNACCSPKLQVMRALQIPFVGNWNPESQIETGGMLGEYLQSSGCAACP